MSRSITGISAGTSVVSADYNFYLSTAELSGTSTDYSTNPIGSMVGIVIDPSVAIGPELDWRGGLAAWDSITVQLAQGFDSLAGTATENTFELLKTLPTWAEVNSTDKFVQRLLNRDEVVNIYVAAKTTGSSWTTNFIKVYTGYIRDVSQSDFGPLQLEIGPKRENYLKTPFLRRLGLESADHNYDSRSAGASPNPFNGDAQGQAVPLLYGALDHAQSVAPHLTPTDDSGLVGGRHGLILCFSDVLYDCDLSADAALWIPGAQIKEPLEVSRTDQAGDVQYRLLTASNAADYIGGATNLVGQGCFVGFTDDLGPSDEGQAGEGFLLIKKIIPMRRVHLRNIDVGATTWSNGDLDDDDSTSVDGTNWQNDALKSDAELALMAAGDDSISLERFAIYARFKLTTSASVTWTLFLRPFTTNDFTIGGNAQDIGSSPSGTSINNWTAGSANAYGWNSGGPTTLRDGLCVQLRPNTTGFNWSAFGGQFDVWFQYAWKSYRDRIYGTVRGIYDSTYDKNSSTYLAYPAEQAAHFIAVVLGGSVDTTVWEGASDDQSADGVVTDFQLVDAEQRGEEVLERLATESMSWIVPNDNGDEQIIYRPGVEGDDTQAQTPFDRSNIVKGTFNWSLTPRDDLYRGAIVNYAWSELEGRYREQAIIAPTSSDYETNITGGSDYTDYVDDLVLSEVGMLQVDARYIQDGDTAEEYCKWLTLLHGVRRQIIEFDTFLEFANITPGDLIYVNMPQIRAYASGDQFAFGVPSLGFVGVSSNATTYEPSGNTTDKGLGAAHDQDLFVVESGTYEGSFRLQWASGSSTWITVATGTLSSVSSGTVANPWRVLPGFDVLSAQIVYDAQAGPRVHIKAVEHPVFLPRTDSL